MTTRTNGFLAAGAVTFGVNVAALLPRLFALPGPDIPEWRVRANLAKCGGWTEVKVVDRRQADYYRYDVQAVKDGLHFMTQLGAWERWSPRAWFPPVCGYEDMSGFAGRRYDLDYSNGRLLKVEGGRVVDAPTEELER